jgi:uncharacterized damage-inducible protein DinB
MSTSRLWEVDFVWEQWRMDILERLMQHDNWGTISLLELSQTLTDAQLDQEFDIGHRSLRATLEHIVYNMEFWTAVMTGQQIAYRPHTDSPLNELIERHKLSYSKFRALARHVHDEQRLEETFTDHHGGPMTFGGAMVHVILHSAEHRTEALHILHRLDAPGMPDMIEVDHGLWDYVRRGF